MDMSIRLEVNFSPETAALLNKLANLLTGSAASLKTHKAPDEPPAPVEDLGHVDFSDAVSDALPAEPVRRRRGRPPGAAKTAERQVAAMEQQNEIAAAPGAAIPPGMAMQGGAVPPGIAMPAMPSVAPVEGVNGEVSLDDLKDCIAQSNEKGSRVWLKIFRSKTWGDGTEKPTWYTAESIPVEMRERVIEEITQALL